MSDVETRYFNAEKIAYALIIAARKLRAYFSAHPIVVYTNAPLRKILHRPESSGRLLNWSIELTEFDIQYRARKTLQAQALADFLLETSFSIDDDQRPPQKMSKGKQVDDKPEEMVFEEVLRFKFQASNNQAEYEALVAAVEYAKCFEATKIAAYCDSQLIVNQVRGDYQVVDSTLQKYHSLVGELIQGLEFWVIQRIAREDNEHTDLLSKLAIDQLPEDEQGHHLAYLEQPAYDRVKIMCVGDGPRCWIDDLKAFIEKDELPADKTLARQIKRKSPRFTVIDGEL